MFRKGSGFEYIYSPEMTPDKIFCCLFCNKNFCIKEIYPVDYNHKNNLSTHSEVQKSEF